MAITIDWQNKIVDSTASINDLPAFKDTLRDLEDDAEGMLYPPIITYKRIDLGGGAYFHAVDFINGYVLRFPNPGGYSINGNLNCTIAQVSGVYVERTKAAAFATTAVGGSGPSPEDIADAVRTELAVEMARIDKNISDVSVVAVGAALNVRATGFTLTTGTETGTYLDTYDLNSQYHQINPVGGVIDGYYEFDVGADYAPVSATMVGRMAGTNNTAEIYAWHWGDVQWRQVGSLAGKNSDVTASVNLFIAHVGTGVDAGKVRIRFNDTAATNNLYIDQLWVSYAPLGAFNSTDRAALNTVPAAVLAAAQATPIHSRVMFINNTELAGAGTPADPMRPA